MSYIDYTVADQVATVTLNRPDKLNGLTLEMLGDLAKAADRAAADKSLRAVLLAANGRDFSAGLDFASAFKSKTDIAKAFVPGLHGDNTFQAAAWAWRRVPVPVIALVHGRAWGGGLQIALGADFRIATPDASLSVLESKWGLIPDMSGTASLSQLVGIDVAKKLTMTGEEVSGTAALQLGLVTAVSEDPLAAAQELIDVIKTRSPDTVAAAKSLFESTWKAGPRTSFRNELAAQLRLLTLKNTAIARAAAVAREIPKFGNRR